MHNFSAWGQCLIVVGKVMISELPEFLSILTTSLLSWKQMMRPRQLWALVGCFEVINTLKSLFIEDWKISVFGIFRNFIVICSLHQWGKQSLYISTIVFSFLSVPYPSASIAQHYLLHPLPAPSLDIQIALYSIHCNPQKKKSTRNINTADKSFSPESSVGSGQWLLQRLVTSHSVENKSLWNV